ncbi:MAG: hypothetical protein AB1941_27175 [Gemmatimonadota bacterium]
MTPPAIAPPPPREAPPEQPQPTPVIPVHAPLRRFGRRDPSGRPSGAALAGSVALHLVLVGLVVAFVKIGPRILERGPAEETVEYFDLAFPEAGPGPQVAAGGPAEGAQFPPAAPSETPPPAGEQPQRTDRPAAPVEELVFPSGAPTGIPQATGAPAPQGGGAPGGQPGGTGTGGSPLRPGIRDPRLFPTNRPVPAKPEQTPHEEYMGRLGSTLGEYNDSVAAEQARARDALDWTLKDKDGNRWGASPGKIHLGKITLPAPFGFASSPDAAAESRRESGQRSEIDRQVADRERSNSFQSRVRATRERKDAERRLIRGESQ